VLFKGIQSKWEEILPFLFFPLGDEVSYFPYLFPKINPKIGLREKMDE